MVDFNNETTTGIPASNIVRILLIEKLENLNLCLTHYNKHYTNNVATSQAELKSSIGSLLMQLKPYLDRSLEKDKDGKTKLLKYMSDIYFNKKNIDNALIIEIVFYLNDICDKLKVTRMDNKPSYNRLDLEESNRANEHY